MPHVLAAVLLAFAALLTTAPPVRGDAAVADPRVAARTAIERGIVFLRNAQQPDGGWATGPGPAVTGLVVALLLDTPGIAPDDPAVTRGVAYILDRVQADGSIRDGGDGILANYNTAICLSALARLATFLPRPPPSLRPSPARSAF